MGGEGKKITEMTSGFETFPGFSRRERFHSESELLSGTNKAGNRLNLQTCILMSRPGSDVPLLRGRRPSRKGEGLDGVPLMRRHVNKAEVKTTNRFYLTDVFFYDFMGGGGGGP